MGLVVLFAAGDAVAMVEVAISQNTSPTRNFLSMLSMTAEFEHQAGTETISHCRACSTFPRERGDDSRGQPSVLLHPVEKRRVLLQHGSLSQSEQLVCLGTTDDLDAARWPAGHRRCRAPINALISPVPAHGQLSGRIRWRPRTRAAASALPRASRARQRTR